MSIAIQWGNVPDADGNFPDKTGFIYLHAVHAYVQNNNGKTSSHPISTGSKITDHFTKENKVFNIHGVISGVDVQTGRVGITDENGAYPQNISREGLSAVSINNTSNTSDFLPDSIGQFFSPAKPQISMHSGNPYAYRNIKKDLESLFIDGQLQLVTLYEYENNKLSTKPVPNLVLTNLVIKEDTDSGEGLHLQITLEEVTFISSERTAIPTAVNDRFKKQMALNKKLNYGTASQIKEAADNKDPTMDLEECGKNSSDISQTVSCKVTFPSGNVKAYTPAEWIAYVSDTKAPIPPVEK